MIPFLLSSVSFGEGRFEMLEDGSECGEYTRYSVVLEDLYGDDTKFNFSFCYKMGVEALSFYLLDEKTTTDRRPSYRPRLPLRFHDAMNSRTDLTNDDTKVGCFSGINRSQTV